MQVLGRSLQIIGLMLVPLALVYYFSSIVEASERERMFGELTLLAAGAGSFWFGRAITGRSS